MDTTQTPPTPAAPATKAAHFCHDDRHETPCPLPCSACADECGQSASKYSAAARELAAYHADIYKAKRNARVAKKGGLR